MRARAARWGILGLALAGCLEYSPHALPTDPAERDLHAKALARLEATPPPAAVRFAVIGDTQAHFDATLDAIESINRRADVSLVIQVGDFVHFGLLPEYQAMNDLFRRLQVPYFVVLGTHDLFANGARIYREMFGPYDLAFTWGGVRFVLCNVNSRHFGLDGTVPDLPWLAEQVAPGPDRRHTFQFTHHDEEAFEFDPALREPYLELLAGGDVDAWFTGHAHKLVFSTRAGIPHFGADSVAHRTYLVVTAHPGGWHEVEVVGF